MGTRAAVYARISDDRTGEAAGVERQQQDATRLATGRGWTVVATLIDNDVSASRYAKKRRPAYDELVRMIEDGEIDAVVAWHVDRLYRQPKELESLIDVVEKRGVLVATCYGDLDLERGDDRMVARILGATAAKESDDKSRRLKRKHQEVAAGGRYHGGGRRPFGYERDGVTVREGEADLIRDAAARVLAGESVRSIVKQWTDAGVQTSTGAAWQTTTVKRMLMSPRLAGLRTHYGTTTPAAWPAIIDEPAHQRLKAILSDPKRNRVAGVAARTYLLTGLVHCAGCKARMTTHRGRYICSIERGGCGHCGISGRLEEDITAAVLTVASSKKVERQVADRATAGEETALVDEVAAGEAELALIAQDYAARRIGRDGYLAAVTAIEQRLDTLRHALARHRAVADTAVLVAASDPEATWETMGYDRQRAAIAQLIRRIDVTPSSRQAGFYDFERVKVIWH